MNDQIVPQAKQNYSNFHHDLPTGSTVQADSRAIRAAFLRNLQPKPEADSPREMPRAKRERVQRYYSRVITLALSALDDGSQSPPPSRDFIELLLSALGYEVVEWTRCTDESASEFAACAVRLNKEMTKNRFLANHRKQRERLMAWQGKAGNPILVEHRHFFELAEDSEPGRPKGKHYSEYKLPFGELIRDIIEDCPIGTRDEQLKKAVKRHAAAYLQRFGGTSKHDKKKRQHSPESNAARAATVAFDAFIREIQKSGEVSAANLIRAAFEAKFGDFYNGVFTAKSNGGVQLTKIPCATSVTYLSEAETGEFWHALEVEDVAQFRSWPEIDSLPELPIISDNPAPFPAVNLGQTIEKFVAENFSSDGKAGNWRDQPTTDKQRDLLLRGGAFDIPVTRGEASDRISELLASGALCDWLSLAELKSFDPKASGRGKKERRFCCPLCGTGKRVDHEHRSLSVNTDTGAYFCHRCNAEGKLREFCETVVRDQPARAFQTSAPVEEKKDDRWWSWYAKAKDIANTPAAQYLAGRGVPPEVAAQADVRFLHWYIFGSVLFALRDRDKGLVAMAARSLKTKEKRTQGELSKGVFFATPGALDANTIAITEAPIDALALAACGFDAIALCGVNWPEWLPDALAGKDVLLAQDADQAGDECATKLAAALEGRAVTLRLRPIGAKDWAEIAEIRGLDTVRALLDGSAQEAAEPAAEGPAVADTAYRARQEVEPPDWECPF